MTPKKRTPAKAEVALADEPLKVPSTRADGVPGKALALRDAAPMTTTYGTGSNTVTITVTHSNPSFTGTITVQETVVLGFTSGTATVTVPASSLGAIASLGFQVTVGAPGPAPAYDANLDALVQPIVSNSGSTTNGALRAAFVPAVVLSGTGIDPTGATDSTAAIQAKIDAAAGAGAAVYAPAGTYLVAGLIIRSYTVLLGAGREKTIFKLPAGSTSDVLISDSFASLTGGATSGGVAGVRIADLSIDGNKANASSGGWGLRKYGYRWHIANVSVRNCKAGGIYSEWSAQAGAGADGGFMEDLLSNLRVYGNGGIGVQWRGPHDTRIEQTLIYSNTSHGLTIEGSNTYHAGGIVTTAVHVYGNGGDGVRIVSTNNQGASVVASTLISESNTGTGLVLAANGSVIGSGNFYNNGIYGIDVQSSAAGYSIYASLQNNATSQINFTADGGDAVIVLSTFTGAAGQSSMTGSINPTTQLEIVGTGTGTNTTKVSFPGSLSVANGLTVAAGTAFFNDAAVLRLPRTSGTTAGGLWYNSTNGRLSYYDGVNSTARDLATINSASSTSLGSATDAINTNAKFQGKQVFNTTLNRPVWATGSTATSTWAFADGTTAFTPA